MAKGKRTPINPREFLNSTEEVHALVMGWVEVVCPWPPFIKKVSRQLQRDIAREFHYYRLGRALGVFTWLGIIAAIKGIIFL